MRSSAILLAACLVGCYSESDEARNECPIGMTHTTSVEAPYIGEGVSTNLRVSPVLMRMCAIRFGKLEEGPRYWYDPTALAVEDEDVLLQLARCVTKGPLAGRALTLVASPEPQGETGDASIADRRADRVAGYLVNHGVAPARVTTSTPDVDAGAFLRDGRVEVRLAGR